MINLASGQISIRHYFARFARKIYNREQSKGAEGQEFISFDESTRSALVDRDMERLGVAALGMFNRKTVSIRQNELSDDIAFFGLERETKGGLGTRLTQVIYCSAVFSLYMSLRRELALRRLRKQ